MVERLYGFIVEWFYCWMDDWLNGCMVVLLNGFIVEWIYCWMDDWLNGSIVVLLNASIVGCFIERFFLLNDANVLQFHC